MTIISTTVSRNGVALILNKRVQNAVLGCNLKNERMISSFPRQTIQYHVNPSLCPNYSIQFSRSVTSNSLRIQGLQMPGFPVQHQLPELTQTHIHRVGDAIQMSHPLSSPSPPAFNLSQHQGLFQWVSSLHQVAKYWSFSFSITSSKEYSGMISFSIDWLDLLEVQGTVKSLLKYHSSKASIPWCSAFFMAQLSHPYMTIGKITALTRWTFTGKIMSLLLNMLSRLVIAFLPMQSKCLLISWLQSPSAVILKPKKIKSVTVSIVSPSICHEIMGPDAMILAFWMLNFKPTFSLSSFTFIKRLFSSSLSAIRVVSSAYLRLLIFLPEILIPACASSTPAFLMMCSAYKLNKQGDNIQPWCTPFLIWNQSVVPCSVLTAASWPAHRFLRRQVRGSGVPVSLIFFN